MSTLTHFAIVDDFPEAEAPTHNTTDFCGVGVNVVEAAETTLALLEEDPKKRTLRSRLSLFLFIAEALSFN